MIASALSCLSADLRQGSPGLRTMTAFCALTFFGMAGSSWATEREVESTFFINTTPREAASIRASIDHYTLRDIRIERRSFQSSINYLIEKLRPVEEGGKSDPGFAFSIGVSEKFIHSKEITYTAESATLAEALDEICRQGDFYWSCGKFRAGEGPPMKTIVILSDPPQKDP